ncbi:MAG: class I SAM-dependent methyltransferase [Thermoplasmatota archaeon]
MVTDPSAQQRDTWNRIAASFGATRPDAWPEVLRFAGRAFPPGARVLDLACGNGRHARALAERGHRVVAADFARSALASVPPHRDVRVCEADARALPFRAASFDGALFIAGLHNIEGRGERLGALAELGRVLKPGASALATVWARRRGALKDQRVPWVRDGVAAQRYYHFYDRTELREDLRAAGFTVVSVSRVNIDGRAVAGNLFAEVVRP